jgi:DNA polymerase III epsilon subunit-like protein
MEYSNNNNNLKNGIKNPHNILIFDTETTGLLPRNISVTKYNESVPEIIQLSWIIYNINTNKIISQNNHLIKIKGKNHPKAFETHGISDKMSKDYGKPIKEILGLFLEDVKISHLLVAHNIEFDKKIIQIECIRNYGHNALMDQEFVEYCTMLKGYRHTDVYYHIKSSRTGELIKRKKNPKLMELHEALFNSIPNNLHDAYIDILVCFRCMYYMLYKKDPLYNGVTAENILRETKKTKYVEDIDFREIFNKYCGLND